MTTNKRDLHADLAICDAATAGELFYMPSIHSEYTYEVCRHDFMDTIVASVIEQKDAEFITNAYEGWSEAIRRAIAAEAENEQLREQRDYWRVEAKAANLLNAELNGECAGYEEENERLRGELYRIVNTTMSQHTSLESMLRAVKRIAREALGE